MTRQALATQEEGHVSENQLRKPAVSEKTSSRQLVDRDNLPPFY
jgi:hypothetical protein